MRIVVLSEHRESKDLSIPPSPPRPRPPRFPRLRFTPNEVEGLLPTILSYVASLLTCAPLARPLG
jgi:hypothetical protein